MSGADLRDPSFEGHVKPRWQKRQRRRRRRGRARARANLSTFRWIDSSIYVLFHLAPEQEAQVREIAKAARNQSVKKTRPKVTIWRTSGAVLVPASGGVLQTVSRTC